MNIVHHYRWKCNIVKEEENDRGGDWLEREIQWKDRSERREKVTT